MVMVNTKSSHFADVWSGIIDLDLDTACDLVSCPDDNSCRFSLDISLAVQVKLVRPKKKGGRLWTFRQPYCCYTDLADPDHQQY